MASAINGQIAFNCLLQAFQQLERCKMVFQGARRFQQKRVLIVITRFSLGRKQWLLLSLGIVAGMIAYGMISSWEQSKAWPHDPIRTQAWEKIAPRLVEVEKDANRAGKRHHDRVVAYFAEKRLHSRASPRMRSAGAVSGPSSKANSPAMRVGLTKTQLRDAFERHFFTSDDLQILLQSAIVSYLTELEGDENALLVAIRADLSEQDLPALRGLAALRNDDVFKAEYRKMLAQVIPAVTRDLKVTVGREAVVWVGSEIASCHHDSDCFGGCRSPRRVRRNPRFWGGFGSGHPGPWLGRRIYRRWCRRLGDASCRV